MQSFSVDPGALAAAAGTIESLAARLEEAAGAVSAASAALAAATGNPVASGAVDGVAGQTTGAMRHVARSLDDDAVNLRQTVERYQQADQAGASIAATIIKGL